jgi:hypothetical protein
MRFLRHFLLGLGTAVPVLAALFLLNVGVHRLIGPTTEQREALAMLQTARDAPREGGNAFALLWLMRYDVPDADIERIAATDVREAETRFATGHSLKDLVPADRPRLAAPESASPSLCEERTSGCLAHVRANVEGTRTLIAEHSRWIERMRLFERRDHYNLDLPLTMETPLPDPGPSQRLRLSALALAWVEGRQEEALIELCGNIGAWRRLRSGTNSLVFSMIAVSFAKGGIDLFAEMLAELPMDAKVPAACATTFAPVTADDVSMCTEMGGEFAWVAEASTMLDKEGERRAAGVGRELVQGIFTPLVRSSRQFVSWMSTPYAEVCKAPVIERARADIPMFPPPLTIARLACASAIVDCVLAETGAPHLSGYHARLLDMAARLRLAATLLWLRETRDDPRPLADRLASRPDHLRSGTRATGIGEDGRSLWIENLDKQKFGERTTLALAPAAETMQ